jgi:bifunctional non-homologous end joining protein LigD
VAGLETYRAKRDFTVTTEPKGKVASRKAKELRFVVQRHAATRLHYDLRLELEGVYKSWAVTKVPALDPAVKRLAVEVEDHPIEYGTFEGIIPEGQYGAGTVQLWDAGTWRPKSDNPGRDLEKGHLSFELLGNRLRGGWALVRMRDEPKRLGKTVRYNWLLIKERDEFARPGDPEALAAEETSVKTGRTLDEIAGAKRPKVWQSSHKKGDGETRLSEPRLAVKKKNRKAGARKRR